MLHVETRAPALVHLMSLMIVRVQPRDKSPISSYGEWLELNWVVFPSCRCHHRGITQSKL
jgi:hypothetical protein